MMDFQKKALLIGGCLLISGTSAKNTTHNANNPCDLFPNGVNATGSLSMPGFQVNSSYPASNWTWSAYVGTLSSEQSSFNDTTIITGFGLKTSPIQNLTDPNLPYQGCAMSFHLSDAALANSIHDTGDCTATLSDACVQEILSAANSSSSSASGTSTTTATQCGTILSLVSDLGLDSSSSCHGLLEGGGSSGLTVKNVTSATNQDACPLVNPGNSSATSPAFFAFENS
ncbi:hypothetical protein EG329_004559 [Mollisiaceae sp. DMI_Dod_QoI]|nr:hypothetical protein EG329_004559 [Helotiales sp. DMI_Dod_QoI]